jgi:hypothetical protein
MGTETFQTNDNHLGLVLEKASLTSKEMRDTEFEFAQ